jgi:hypothetical protein
LILISNRFSPIDRRKIPLLSPIAYAILLLPIILFPACSENLEIVSGELGSSLAAEGEISNSSLEYRLRRFSGGTKNRDLFNSIYFQGDTLCFSFELTRRVGRKMVSVWFINPETGERYRAERIDIHEKRISGFSLLGSILENYHKQYLDAPIPHDAFCCRDIPIDVEISIDDNQNQVRKNLSGSFRIAYE